jgi:hypothetical protein
MPKYIELPQYRYKPSIEEMVSSSSEMNYKSPIETINQQVQAKFEGDVMELIHSYGINVDKDELVKALKYDRDQYRKGFEDGCKGATDRIKAEVAREIFEEIEEHIEVSSLCSLDIEEVKGILAELKYKYTGEQE